MFIQGQIYDRTKLHEAYGGSALKNICTLADYAFLMLFTSKGAVEQVGEEAWTADGLYLYPGEGQTGDMRFAHGNRALGAHSARGNDLHLFRHISQDRYRYVGQMVCIGHHEQLGPDRHGHERREIIFELLPIAALQQNWEDTLPDETAARQPQALADLRERGVAHSVDADTPAERRSLAWQRTEEMRADALARAAGVCEGCGEPAPFQTSSGEPYLEVHHIRRLTDGGPDHVQRVAALCPNCHRQAHHAPDREEFNRALARIVKNKRYIYRPPVKRTGAGDLET